MVVLSAKVLPKIRMSVSEFFQADLPEGNRYELVEGEVEVTPPPAFDHDDVCDRLNRLFVRYSERHRNKVAHISQHGWVVHTRRRTARGPDFALYSAAQYRIAKERGWTAVIPELAVEIVSESSTFRDYSEKRDDYWRSGVPEYWIFDEFKPGLTVFLRGDDEWNEAFFAPGQTYRPRRFPGMAVPVARILGLSGGK